MSGVGRCSMCGATILNSDWPIGGGYLVSAKHFEALRKSVNDVEPPHEHCEGMNECDECDQPFLLAVAALVAKQHAEVERLRAVAKAAGEAVDCVDEEDKRDAAAEDALVSAGDRKPGKAKP